MQVGLHAGEGHGIAVSARAQTRDQQTFHALRDQTTIGHVAGINRPLHVLDEKHLGIGQSARVEVAAMVTDCIREASLRENVLSGQDVVADNAPAVPCIDQLSHVVGCSRLCPLSSGREQDVPAVEHVTIADHEVGGVVLMLPQTAVWITGNLDREIAQCGDTVLAVCSCCSGDIGIAGAVDHHVCQDDTAAQWRGHDDATNLVALHHSTASEAPKPDFGAKFHQFGPEPLGLMNRIPALPLNAELLVDLSGEAGAVSVPVFTDEPGCTDAAEFVEVLDDQRPCA